jgi:hypothetical protein
MWDTWEGAEDSNGRYSCTKWEEYLGSTAFSQVIPLHYDKYSSYGNGI